MHQTQEKQKAVVAANNPFDESSAASQYALMHKRIPRSIAGLVLGTLAALTLPSLAQTAAEKPLSPEGRWEKDIRAFEAADKTNPPPRNAILFVGSSSIRLWTSAPQAFPGHRILNRGFGGSQLADSVAFADRIVIPYRPKLVVLYAGDNDLASGKSPAQVFGDFQAFVRRIRAALPETRIAYIAIKPCPAREKLLDRVKTTNRLIREYTAVDGRLLFVDVFTPMLTAEGRPRADLYLKDGLHPNAQGYELWASILRPILDKHDAP
jgi:lysophospholipase L1-like esterase